MDVDGENVDEIESREDVTPPVKQRSWGWREFFILAFGAGAFFYVLGNLGGTDDTYGDKTIRQLAAEGEPNATALVELADSGDPYAKTLVEAGTLSEGLSAWDRQKSGLLSENTSPGTSSIGLVGPQANALRSAKQYLSMSGFSRKGLIDQLSSDAGEGYALSDATAAVDSLDVDWNEQAVRSAQDYLSMMGFSCQRLIDQLSSDAGSKYTRSEARYGAEKAGAC